MVVGRGNDSHVRSIVSVVTAQLTTARVGCICGAGFGLLQHFIRPPLPALGHLGNRQQPLGLSAIMEVDAKYLSDGEIMSGSLDAPDLISGTHLTLDDDAQIRPGAHRL